MKRLTVLFCALLLTFSLLACGCGDGKIDRNKELQSAMTEADGVKADYEKLKNVIFTHAETAEERLKYRAIYDRSEYFLFAGKWAGASDLLEKAGMLDEYNGKGWK